MELTARWPLKAFPRKEIQKMCYVRVALFELGCIPLSSNFEKPHSYKSENSGFKTIHYLMLSILYYGGKDELVSIIISLKGKNRTRS